MAKRTTQHSINIQTLRRMNRVLLRQIRNLASRQTRGQRFRSTLQAVEAVEPAGLEVYNIGDPVRHVDLSRLKAPPEDILWSILNGDVLVRRFERTVEQEFVLVLDLSRSMRYPMRQFYAGLELNVKRIGPDWKEQILRTKPSLLKLIAGCFTLAAFNSGFFVRVVTFGQGKIKEGGRLRARPGVVAEMLDDIDRHFFETTAHEHSEESLYRDVIRRMERRKGVFLFVGDFMDAVHDWDPPPSTGRPSRKRQWLQILSLFRDWATRRKILVARINHYEEVGPPASIRAGERPNPWEDRCDERAEGKPCSMQEMLDYREPAGTCRDRLRRQQEWDRRLWSTLRSCCRGYLLVHNETSWRELVRALHRMWLPIVER